jgi:hypothetical protein
MPFTVSHAAAVLPFKRLSAGRLPMAALMIGSMSPDFPYFMPIGLERVVTHNLSGLFGFCWPASLFCWLLYAHFLERPTMALLPRRWSAAFPSSDREVSWRTLALASAAVILGGATHIVWDSFTHGGSPVVGALRVLRIEVAQWNGHTLHLYGLLQHVSSVVGLLILAAWAVRQVRRADARVDSPADAESSVPRLTAGERLGAIALLFVSSSALASVGYLEHPHSRFDYRLFYTATGGMAGWIFAWCVVALLINLRSRPTTT